MIRAYYLPPGGKPSAALTDKEQILEVFRRKEGLLWVDMESPTPEETNFLADGFGFHPVAVETCREVTSQPLVHAFDDYLFMVIHAVNIQTRGLVVDTLEVDIFWGKQFVLTYHQVPVKSISEMRDQCEKDCERLLSRGAAFFIHAVVDKIIDNFTPTLDRIEYLLEELEIQIFRHGREPAGHDHNGARNLYVGRHEPHERGHQGADDHRDRVHADHVHRQPVRDELQVYARNLLEVGLSGRAAPHGGQHSVDGLVLPAQEVDLARPAFTRS
jgi:Mg2+ and Co2+ transporter CorA